MAGVLWLRGGAIHSTFLEGYGTPHALGAQRANIPLRSKRKELTRFDTNRVTEHEYDAQGAPHIAPPVNTTPPLRDAASKGPKAPPHDSFLMDAPKVASTESAESLSFGGSQREIARHYRTCLTPEHLFREPLAPLAKTTSGATLYGPHGNPLSLTPPSRPVKIAFLTSIRDVGLEEHVGTFTETGRPESYVKGTIETALEAVNDDRLGPFAEIVAIITDDLASDLTRGDYAADPAQDGRWIFPKHLRNQRGELATSYTFNVPSTFRSLPLKDTEGRKARKIEFESKVFQIMRETGADILLSDHFLARIDYLIHPAHFKLLGRVLNTHPGIIRPDHPYTCLGKFPYDQMRLHARGLRLTSDKSVVPVPPNDIAGATFHFITAGIDRGPVLCDAELTRISPTDSDVKVAQKLYKSSKYHAFIEGVRHYTRNIFPILQDN